MKWFSRRATHYTTPHRITVSTPRKYLTWERKNFLTDSRIQCLVMMVNHPKNRKTKDVKVAFGGPEDLHFQRCSDVFQPEMYHHCIALKKMIFFCLRNATKNVTVLSYVTYVRTNVLCSRVNFLEGKWKDVMSRIALLLILQIEGEKKCVICVCL